ncbi:hypothetical protein QCA50_018504 [Cerrena zonata]|uniref:Cytochrome P450 n=1 Tax=Cerrena zonata TaxID=2478898 RepID=A0AAW0FJU7_9APHY
MEPIVFCIAFVASIIFLKWIKRIYKPSLPLPPGPKGYPIIGNMLDVPSVMPWKAFQEWSKTYGDVMFLDLPG